MPFQSKRGGGDGGVFGRITEEVEKLTLPEAGGKARRFDTRMWDRSGESKIGTMKERS